MTSLGLAAPLHIFVNEAHQKSVEYHTERINKKKFRSAFVVIGYRGSTHVVTAFPQHRDPMLWFAKLVVGGFGCDRLAICMDSYMYSGTAEGFDPKKVLINPDTGKRFKEGDMERAFNNGATWVSESLMTYGIDKVSGEIRQAMQMYRVTGRAVAWKEPHLAMEVDDWKTDGLIPDGLREALQAHDMAGVVRRFAPPEITAGMTRAQQRGHMDAVCLRIAAAEDIPIIYACDNKETSEVVDRSLSDLRHNADMGVPGLHMERITGDDQ